MTDTYWFKFYPSEWLTGTINFVSKPAQADFIFLKCHYFTRGCKMTLEQMKKLIPESYQELLDENIVKLNGSNVEIKYLDEAYKERKKRSNINSRNGRKGGLKKKQGNSLEQRESEFYLKLIEENGNLK